ncbi:hypothetical protein GCM10007304_22880 [Rhodococcoides trifolii]|uniref:GH26 domain-containing protein n=1 Tax=Rhodococcoides trifolii TaxID=908250 RepID=A0A917D4R6_9NOCA|nr:glycosyl hydrolase [Rhodococcus trifolii]GGG08222.1 hypothetical protein GCM10007304_22880 [Rhodococcus trifolii]
MNHISRIGRLLVVPLALTAALTVAAPGVADAAPGISTAKLRFGIVNEGGPLAGAELDRIATQAGEAPSVVMTYQDFRSQPPISQLDAVAARGATTMITWEPWAWGGGTVQPDFRTDRITAGAFDAYIRSWGTALARWGKPVMLRFGHEMNANWYPWADGVNGNGAGDYVAAYRRVHDVLRSAGAANVSFVWGPNVPDYGMTPLKGLYPGSSYVDQVSLDGYNWGTTQSWSSWQSASAIYATGISQMRNIAPGKRIIVAEVSSAEAGGSKSTWIKDAISYFAAKPDISAVVWFNLNKEQDWRFDSTAASATAFRDALARRPR